MRTMKLYHSAGYRIANQDRDPEAGLLRHHIDRGLKVPKHGI